MPEGLPTAGIIGSASEPSTAVGTAVPLAKTAEEEYGKTSF